MRSFPTPVVNRLIDVCSYICMHATLGSRRSSDVYTSMHSFSDGSCWEIMIIKQIHTFTSNKIIV